MNENILKLCLVTNLQDQSFDFYEPFLIKAIEGGVTSIQFRAKNKTLIEFRRLAEQFKNLTARFHIPLIINDHLEVAKEIEAEGVHLGQSDLSPLTARQILGPEKIIGWSIETLPELEMANQLNCIDYVAASAVFPSQTKKDCKTIWGMTGLKKVTQLSKHPVVAIGGINLTNIASVMACGVKGVAVISAIHDDIHPEKITAALRQEINKAIEMRGKHVCKD